MAVDMFLKIDTIKGETTDKHFSKEHAIDVLAWGWGVTNSGTTHMGGGGGSGKASFQDLSVTKYVDTASHALLHACATGEHFPNAVLSVRKAAGKAGAGQAIYIVITMKEVLVTSVSTGGSGGEDRLTENLSLNFAEVKFTYKPQLASGALGDELPFTYDIAANHV